MPVTLLCDLSKGYIQGLFSLWKLFEMCPAYVYFSICILDFSTLVQLQTCVHLLKRVAVEKIQLRHTYT